MNRPQLTYCCAEPGCKSHVTLHPTDANENPVKALEKWGWSVAPNPGRADGSPVVEQCHCPAHARKTPLDVPVPSAG